MVSGGERVAIDLNARLGEAVLRDGSSSGSVADRAGECGAKGRVEGDAAAEGAGAAAGEGEDALEVRSAKWNERARWSDEALAVWFRLFEWILFDSFRMCGRWRRRRRSGPLCCRMRSLRVHKCSWPDAGFEIAKFRSGLCHIRLKF
jgi:hypothetical protein